MKELMAHTGYRSEVLELKHMLNQFSLSLGTKGFVTRQNLNIFHIYEYWWCFFFKESRSPEIIIVSLAVCGWSAEGQYTLAQIYGDLSELQRLLLFAPMTCSLTGVHQMLQTACTVPCMSSRRNKKSTLEQMLGTISMVLGLNVI